MEREGYDRDFSAAVNITAATTGLVIPPSHILIVYSLASGGVSIAALFVAGYLPGILVGVSLMAVGGIIAKRSRVPVTERSSLTETWAAFVSAVPSLLLLVIVMGGIIVGVFTATEAAAVAVLYALVLAFAYRGITPADLPEILLDTAATTAVVLLLVGVSMGMSWMLAYTGAPQALASVLVGIAESKFVILLMMNIAFLAVGVFVDITPAVLILTPIFLPVATALGVDPVHFGIIIVLNLCIGLCTPPVGTVLFVGVGVARTTIAGVIRPLLPLYAAMIVALALVTYVPAITLWLPRALGLM
jgi:tripartite ATP-independent transporter DctM subunit